MRKTNTLVSRGGTSKKYLYLAAMIRANDQATGGKAMAEEAQLTDEEITARAQKRLLEIRQKLGTTLNSSGPTILTSSKNSQNSEEAKPRERKCTMCGNHLPDDRGFICESCDGIVEREQQERAERDRLAAIDSELSRSGLPLAYRDGSRSRRDVRKGGARSLALADLLIAGQLRGLYIHGPAGPDKTTLAASLLAELIRAGLSGRFVSVADMITDIDATRAEGALITRADIVKPLIDTQAVVIDDLGKERATDYTAGVLLQILDGRYTKLSDKAKQQRALIITSNYPLDGIIDRIRDETLAEPIRRRIAELTVSLEMK